MKKLILLLVVPLYTINCYSQIKTSKLIDEKVGLLNIINYQYVNINTNDTLYELVFYFKNAKYSSIIDIVHFKLSLNIELREFINDLNLILNSINNDSELSFTRKHYYISSYIQPLGNNIWLASNDDTGYTILRKNNAKKLVDFFASADIKLNE